MVPVSQPSCESCGKSLENFLERHVCSACGRPQKLLPKFARDSAGEDYFSVLGVYEKFTQDRGELQKNFYAASRVLHPDRFTLAEPQLRQQSLERMSFLNEAYRTLQDPAALRGFILRFEGVLETQGARQSIPAELAEDWFELQDQEGPQLQVEAFEKKLLIYRDELNLKLKKIEETLDHGFEVRELDVAGHPSRQELLQELQKIIHAQSYLKSMEKDVERLKLRG